MTQGIGSSEYNALIGQMQGLFGQLSSMGAIKGGSYLNSIWGVAGNVEGLVTGNDAQKASALQGLINNVLSIVEKLGNQEAARARKEVKEGEKKAQELTAEQKKALSELDQSLEEIGSDIDNQRSIVDTANGTLDASQQKLEEKQELINEIIEQIQEKQQELASTTDPETQKAILSEIQGLSGQIAGIVAEIETIQADIQAAAESVEQAVIEIETAKGNAVEVQENGTLKVSELAQQGTQEVTKNTETRAEGVKNGITAKALKTAATASSSNLFTAAEAPKLEASATDNGNACGIRTDGALGNLRTLMQGIGGLNENINLLNTFKNAIGGALEAFNGCVGDYNTKIEPLITSIGSFLGDGGVTASTAALDAAVQTDLQNIDSKLSDETPVEEEPAEDSEEQDKEPAQSGNINELLTPNVELINPFEIAS